MLRRRMVMLLFSMLAGGCSQVPATDFVERVPLMAPAEAISGVMEDLSCESDPDCAKHEVCSGAGLQIELFEDRVVSVTKELAITMNETVLQKWLRRLYETHGGVVWDQQHVEEVERGGLPPGGFVVADVKAGRRLRYEGREGAEERRRLRREEQNDKALERRMIEEHIPDSVHEYRVEHRDGAFKLASHSKADRISLGRIALCRLAKHLNVDLK